MSFYTTPEARLAKESSQCRKCEARIEINEKLHQRNVELGTRIAELGFQASCTKALLEAQERYVARITALLTTIRAADGYLEMGMRELAQDELRKALESGE